MRAVVFGCAPCTVNEWKINTSPGSRSALAQSGSASSTSTFDPATAELASNGSWPRRCDPTSTRSAPSAARHVRSGSHAVTVRSVPRM